MVQLEFIVESDWLAKMRSSLLSVNQILYKVTKQGMLYRYMLL